MIENSDGSVAVVFKQPIRKYVVVGSNEYVFVPQRSVSFSWVKPEDVDKILSMEGDCGCPNRSQTRGFRLMSDQEYRIWNNLAER